jgi:hypothetical protein
MNNQKKTLVNHANDDCLDGSELSTRFYTHDEFIKTMKRRSRAQRTLFSKYKDSSNYIPLPKIDNSMSETLRRAKGGEHHTFEFRGYVYHSMPSNGWNCWVYALRLMALEWEMDLHMMMQKYYPDITYEAGQGLLVPDRFVANSKLEAYHMPVGLVVMHDHAFIKLKRGISYTEFVVAITKAYLNVVRPEDEVLYGDDIIYIPGWIPGRTRAYAKREYAQTWEQPGFMEVQVHPRQDRHIKSAVCANPRIEMQAPNIHGNVPSIDLPYLREHNDTVTFYPSTKGQCVWECIGFYYLWSQYEWHMDMTDLLNYVVTKEVPGVVYKRYVKRVNTFGLFVEELVTNQILADFQTKYARIVKTIQQNFGTASNTISDIQSILCNIGLELTTRYVGKTNRPVLEVYYSQAPGDTRTLVQLMADPAVALHARLHIPVEYVQRNVTIQHFYPRKYGQMPTQYCAEAALSTYGVGYKDTVRVRRWFNGSKDNQTDIDDILSHLDTQANSNTTIISTNSHGLHTVHHSDVMFLGVNTSKTLFLHITLAGNHWVNVDMKDVLAWCDPNFIPKHGTIHTMIDGYIHSTPKTSITTYTPIPPTLINPHAQPLHDFMSKHLDGHIVLDVPRQTKLLPLNTTGRAFVARINIEHNEIVLEYAGTTDKWPLTDFHYQMACGNSPTLGYIKLQASQHLGSGVYISCYVPTTKCDLRLTVQESKSIHASSIQAQTSAMFDSQLKVFELSVLSDTVRRRAIIAGDPIAIDQACNFCYAVTGTKDANYCEAQLIDAIQILARQREEDICGYKHTDTTQKMVDYLTSAWEGEQNVVIRSEMIRQNEKFYAQRASYYLLKYGFNTVLGVAGSLASYIATRNISRIPTISYKWDKFVPNIRLFGNSLLEFDIPYVLPTLTLTNITKIIPKGKIVSIASRRNPDKTWIDSINTFLRGYSVYEDVCKSKLVDRIDNRIWLKRGIQTTLAVATGFLLYHLVTKLKDKMMHVLPARITHPELVMYDHTREIRRQHGCPVCQGLHLQCKYCDHLDRNHEPRQERVSPYRTFQQLGLFAYLHGLESINRAAYVIANSDSKTKACFGVAFILCSSSIIALKPWLFQRIRGGTYEPQHQAVSNFKRFPKVMDNTLTKEMTCKETLQNCTSYSLPGFQSVDQMIEELRTNPVKIYDMKNTTSLEPLFQDIRLNCIDANTKAALTAVFCRQLRYDIQPDPKFIDKIPFMQINMSLLIEATMTAELPPFSKYAEQFPLARRLKYIKGWMNFLTKCGPLKNDYTLFGKMWEMIQTTKRGRIICGPDPNTIGPASYFGWLLIIIRKLYWNLFMQKDDIFANVPHERKQMPFVHGCNSSEIRERLEKCFRTFKKLRLITLDIKGFDGSQSRNLLRLDVAFHLAMFRIMCARIGLSHHHTEEALRHATTLDATLKLYIRRAESHYKIKRQTDRVLAAVFKAHQSVFSGNSYLTTLGNTDRQLHTVFALFQYGNMMDFAWAFASGDDMLIAIEDEYYDAFRKLLNECYAPDGTTGVYGSGMILKEIITSPTSVKFLSKKVEVFGAGIDTVVEFYRDIPRFVQTGGSGKKLPIPNAMINYMNTCQLKSQCYGDKAMLAHIAFRERTMPHQIATKDAWSMYFNDSETVAKGNIHVTTNTRDLYMCATRDPSFALMKAMAKTHEIILQAEGGQSLPPVCL